jgi:hypothetical protein
MIAAISLCRPRDGNRPGRQHLSPNVGTTRRSAQSCSRTPFTPGTSVPSSRVRSGVLAGSPTATGAGCSTFLWNAVGSTGSEKSSGATAVVFGAVGVAVGIGPDDSERVQTFRAGEAVATDRRLGDDGARRPP